jgi:two-component system, chemotaxis family, CheB/CheR fusion protein
VDSRPPEELSDVGEGAAATPIVSIVGVGASASGLEAFGQLLTHLPIDTGLGFVLVQHLDPNHESKLDELLAKSTAMPVLRQDAAGPGAHARRHVAVRQR